MQQKMPWEEDWNAAGAAGPQVVIPVSPTVQAKDAADLARVRQSIGLDAADAARKAATQSFDVRKAAADAARAEADAALAKANQEKAAKAAVVNTVDPAAGLQRAIDDMRQKYALGPGSTSGVNGWRDWFNTPANAAFDKAASAARGYVGPALGLTASQLNSPGEIEAAIGPYIPTSRDYDANIQSAMDRLQGLANDQRKRAGFKLPPTSQSPVPFGLPAPAAMEAAGGATRTEVDPRASAMIDSMIRAGASPEQINAALQPMGFDPVDADKVAAAQKYLRANPRYKGSFGEATRTLPNGALAQAAASGPAIGFVGALNGATGGFLDEGIGAIDSALTGKPLDQAINEANAAKQAGADARPGWSVAGNLLGTGLSTYAGGIGAARLGLTSVLGKAAPFAGDLAVGALSGAGEDNDSRFSGALLGTAGAGVGRGVFGGLGMFGGRVLRGGQNASARFLADRGVRLTGGSSLGGRWKALEDKATSAVGAGDLIASRQAESIGDLNRGIANEALSHIGVRVPDNIEVGSPLHSFAQGAWDNAYGNARAGMTALEDAQYRTDVFNLQNAADNGRLSEDSAKRLAKITKDVVTRRFGAGGGMSGDTYKQVVSDLRKLRGSVADPELKSAIGDLRGILDASGTRHSAPDAVQAMRDTDLGYAKWKIYQDAASRVGGEPGMASPAQLRSAVLKADTSAGRNRYNQGQALLQDWSNAAMDVLPSQVPDSGTAGRIALLTAPLAVAGGGAAGGGVGYAAGDAQTGTGVGSGLTIGGLLTLAALNTPAGRAAAQRAVLGRGPLAQKAGNALVKKGAKRLGYFGRALGTTLAAQ